MKKGYGKIIITVVVLLLVIVLASNISPILEKITGEEISGALKGDQDVIQMLSSEESDSSSGSGAAEIGTNAAEKKKDSTPHLRDKRLLYDNSTEVVTMYLTVSSGNSKEGTDHTWEEVNTYSDYDYSEWGVDRYKVEGLLQVGTEDGIAPGNLGYGRTAPNATVQVRGQTSSRNAQKNYKIELKKEMGLWNGQRTIALNKHMTDGLRFRNKMCFDLLSGIDEIMGLRTTFVHLYVKDLTASGNASASGEITKEGSEAEGEVTSPDVGFVDYGLYTQVEQLNKTALRTHGLDKNGHLYKVNFFEFYRYEDVIKLATDKDYNKTAFEKYIEIKGDEDHTKLIKMLEDVNDLSIPVDELLQRHFDEENIAYWMAFNILIGNVDTQSRNFYLYSPKNSNTWYIYPWDFDAGLFYQENMIYGNVEYGGWEKGVSNYWGNRLFQRCLKSEDFRKKLDAAVLELKEYLSEERISAAASKYREVTEKYAFSSPDIYFEALTPQQYDEVVKGLPSLIDFYYENYVKSLECPMPFYIGIPELKDGKMTYTWEVSYDFQQDDISYNMQLSKDYDFSEAIDSYTGYWPSYTSDALEPGEYFLKVEAADESGNTITAFDYYVTNQSSKIYGVICFIVRENGTIDVVYQEE